jgi:hypothetical protein
MVVHHGGHDGLAGEIDAHGAFRRLDLSRSTDPRDLPHLHDERGALDAAAVAHDEPRAFEEEGTCGLLRPAGGDKEGSNKGQTTAEHQ